MNNKEKLDYLGRVGRWTEETFPELLAMADTWEQVPVKDFDEGCRLASAIVNARPFLRNVSKYEAARAIKKINAYLEKVRLKSGMAKVKTRLASDTRRYRAVVPAEGFPDEDGTLHREEYREEEVEGRRPKEFALYKHRLPDELRERGEKELGYMYLELAEYRSTLEKYVENPNISREACADMADKTIRCEQRIRAFWAEVDRALEGKKETESLSPEEQQGMRMVSLMKRPGEYTKAEIEAMEDEYVRETCMKARIEFNKKYIRRDDMKKGAKYREQLELRVKELMEWGVTLPKKTAEALNAAGVTIPGVNDQRGKEEGNEDN